MILLNWRGQCLLTQSACNFRQSGELKKDCERSLSLSLSFFFPHSQTQTPTSPHSPESKITKGSFHKSVITSDKRHSSIFSNNFHGNFLTCDDL